MQFEICTVLPRAQRTVCQPTQRQSKLCLVGNSKCRTDLGSYLEEMEVSAFSLLRQWQKKRGEVFSSLGSDPNFVTC